MKVWRTVRFDAVRRGHRTLSGVSPVRQCPSPMRGLSTCYRPAEAKLSTPDLSVRAEAASVVGEEWFLREFFGSIRDRNRLFESHLRECNRLR